MSINTKQNVLECKECILKLKKKLEANGYNILSANDDILIKYPKKNFTALSTVSNTYADTNNSTSDTSCYRACPYHAGASINVKNHSCTYTGNCSVSNSNCPLMNGNIGSGNTGSNSSGTASGNSGTSNYLIRIRPTDIYNGIFLHAIILYGEHCDLKITFEYTKEGLDEIFNTIQFLIA